jgi:radical SAM superfamily enzyme with C-terminal helix-hairpin-helix motif
MSGTDRDHRGRLHSGKDCPEAAVGGCNACVTGTYKRPARRKARAVAKRATRKEARS